MSSVVGLPPLPSSTQPLWSADRADTADPASTSLAGELPSESEVCIVGAGFTGLWTAWHLLQRDPAARVVVLEAREVGFGASGRNGGWVQAALPMSVAEMVSAWGADGMALHRTMVQTVEAIGEFAHRHAPEAGFELAGSLQVARNRAQLQRLAASVTADRAAGLTEADVRMLAAAEVRERIDVTNPLGGVFTAACASVHPKRLVAALAGAVVQLGGVIVENTPVREIEPGRVVTNSGVVRAQTIVRATEGYTSTIAGERRALVPIYSLMIATEPLSDAQWEAIGWRERFTFTDGRHTVIYGQRTSDGRIAFGGRGAPYHWRSAIRDSFDDEPSVHTALQRTLVELFPVLRNVAIEYRWGGPLGIARDWRPSVVFDAKTGLGAAGGYVGDGVGATHLAGRTLAALIQGVDDPVVRLPWVQHRSRRWEPEPFRFAGINAGRLLAASINAAEERGRRAPVRQFVFDRLV